MMNTVENEVDYEAIDYDNWTDQPLSTGNTTIKTNRVKGKEEKTSIIPN